MKKHFTVGEGQVACGKNNHDIVATSKTNQVTCIKCKSSHLFESAINHVVNLQLSEQPSGLLPKEFWKKYITELPGNNSLPRGFK